MQQKVLTFHVEGQHIRTPHYRVVGDSRNYLTARFSFDEAWRGLTKTAVFQGADGSVYHLLLEKDCCVVPAEVIRPARFLVSVFGGDRLTTDRAAVVVEASGMVAGVSPPTPTPDVYDQLLQAVELERQLAQAAANTVTGGVKAAQAAADTATEAAARAVSSADKASGVAEELAGVVDDAKKAADSANSAANAANKAASSVTSATAAANTAASRAASAADAANEAAQRANDAAKRNSSFEKYGVKFIGAAYAERTYNAGGLVAKVGTDTETAQNDFDKIYPWSARRRCCGWVSAGTVAVSAYQGEPGYTEDGSNGDVWVEHSLFYYKHDVNGEQEEITVSAVQLPGFSPAPIFVDKAGNVKQKAYTAAFPAGQRKSPDPDPKADPYYKIPCSQAGRAPWSGTYSTAMRAAMNGVNTNPDCTVTRFAEWYTEWLYMTVEFATRNMQSVMSGCVNFNVSDIPIASVEYTDGHSDIRLADSYLGRLVEGQNVSLYNIEHAFWQDDQIDRITTLPDGTVSVILSSELNYTEFSTIKTIPYRTGRCNAVISSSGSLHDNKSGLYPCVYRGNENPYGNIWQFISDVVTDGEDVAAYYKDISIYYNDDDYRLKATPLNFSLSGQNGYISKMGADERFPFIRLPAAVNGSVATYYGDYYYKPKENYGVIRYGGSLNYGGTSGYACFDMSILEDRGNGTFRMSIIH